MSNSEESQNTTSSDNMKYPFTSQHFAKSVNKIRFNISKAFTFIQDKLKEGIERGDKKISLQSINQEIEFDDESLMERVSEYFNENNIVNSFLPEFTFNNNQNQLFFQHCTELINELLFLDETQESADIEKVQLLDQLNSLVPSNEYMIYRLKGVELNDVKTLIQFMMIAEILYQNKENDESSVLIKYFGLEENRNYAQIDKKYASIFIGFYDSASGKYLHKVNSPGQPVDVIIVLITTPLDIKEIPLEIINERNKSNVDASNNASGFFKKNYEFPSQQARNYTTNSIKRLIKALDFDKDDKISIEDLHKFCLKNSQVYGDELIEQMIVSANRLKFSYQSNPYELERKLHQPLGQNDLKAELRWSVQWSREKKEYCIVHREYTSYWRAIMEKLDEVLPPPRFVPPTYDTSDIDEVSLPSLYNKMQKQMIIKEKPRKIIPDTFKAEAGVIIMNTMSIVPKDKKNNLKKETIVRNPIESVINMRINRDIKFSGNQTISFQGQQYFQEGLRLSQDPRHCGVSTSTVDTKDTNENDNIHPIYKFVPENVMKYSQTNKENTLEKQVKSSGDFGIDPSRITLPSIVQDGQSPQFKGMQNGSTFSEAMRIEAAMKSPAISSKYGQLQSMQLYYENKWYDSMIKKKTVGNQFEAWFRSSDVQTLKASLSKEAHEARSKKFQSDDYKPPYSHTFRDLEPPLDKVPFKNNIKNEQLKPQFNLFDKKDKSKKEPTDREILRKELGFVRFLKIQEKVLNIDGQRYQFLKKDEFGEEEPYDAQHSMFSKKPPFKLYFKGGVDKIQV